MLRHLLGPISGQRAAQLLWQLAHVLAQGIDHGSGVFAEHLDEHDKARMAFHQRDHVGIVRAREQISQ